MADLKTTVSAYMAEATALVRRQMDGAAKASHQVQPHDPQVYVEVPYPEHGENPYHQAIPGNPYTEYGDTPFFQAAPEVPYPEDGGDQYDQIRKIRSGARSGSHPHRTTRSSRHGKNRSLSLTRRWQKRRRSVPI